jgi:hypothetical protein
LAAAEKSLGDIYDSSDAPTAAAGEMPNVF